MTSSVAKARRVVSNSSSSSLKADTEDFPGAGKYSASMPHLDVQLLLCYQASRSGKSYVAPASGSIPSLKYRFTCFAVQSEAMLRLQ
jgi:hypothetical protein